MQCGFPAYEKLVTELGSTERDDPGGNTEG